jgi:hypothetical protein
MSRRSETKSTNRQTLNAVLTKHGRVTEIVRLLPPVGPRELGLGERAFGPGNRISER